MSATIVPFEQSRHSTPRQRDVDTTRTIRRDLEVLEAARFPIYNDTDEDGIVRWWLLTKGVTPARRAA